MKYFLDLFSGIGGFALGAYWAGLRFHKHYFSEIDQYRVKLYQMRFPDAVPLGDIREIDLEKLPKGKWIITGGFPCQDISLAGKGAGITGERSSLWFDMWCIIGILRPQFALVENVGTITVRGLWRILSDLTSIGYDVEWQDIQARDMGAPHKRERIWIVAYPSSPGRGIPTISRSQCENKTYAFNDGKKKPMAYSRCRDRGVQNQSGNGLNTERKSEEETIEIEGPSKRQEILADTNEQHGNDGRHGAGEICWEQQGKAEVRKGKNDGDSASKGLPNGVTKTLGAEEKGQTLMQPQRSDWWAVEPSVGRVAHGLSTVLDCQIRRYGYDNRNHKEAITEIDKHRGKVLRNMWEKRQTTKTPYINGREFSYSLVSRMPYDITHEEWYLGQRIQNDQKLCDLWKTFLSSEKHLQDVQSRMLERIREKECTEKMAQNRGDRLKALGDSIVPQIARLIFEQLDWS